MDYLAYTVLGVFFGLIISLLFFQVDETWKKVVSLGAGNGSFLGIFFWLCSTLNVAASSKTSLLTCYFLAIMCSFFCGCIFLFSRLKLQETNFKLRPLDILLGYKDTMKIYYQNRQREIDELLNYEDLKRENERLRKQESIIIQRDKQLREFKDVVDKSCKGSICIELPDNNYIPVENEFLSIIPSYLQDLVAFSSSLTLLTNDFIKKFPKDHEKQLDWFKAYLLAIGTYTTQYLFDTQNVRVHFRYLDQNGNYSKLITWYQKNSTRRMTPMPSDKGMIYEAGNLRRSLIKSLNLAYHISGKNDDTWEDYLTLVFEEFYENGKPILSMGISVKNHNRYRNQLYFLNYCKFEKIIQQNLLKVNEKINIIELIKKHKEVV